MEALSQNNESNLTEEETSCLVQIFNVDNKLIYSVDIDLSSTILELKISLHRQSLFNTQPSDQQILFNNKDQSNDTTFQQIYKQNNKASFIKLCVIQAPRPIYSPMDTMVLSTHSVQATRIEYDDISDDIDQGNIDNMDDDDDDGADNNNDNEYVEIQTISQHIPSKHRLSYLSNVSDATSTYSTGGNISGPFFARRGSLSVTGPASLRWMQQQFGAYSSDHYRSHSPTPGSQQYQTDNDPSYQPIPDDEKQQNWNRTRDLYDNQYYQQSDTEQPKRSLSPPITDSKLSGHYRRRKLSKTDGNERRKSQLMDSAPKMNVIVSFEEDMDLGIDDRGNIGDRLRDKSRASRGSIDRSTRNKEEYKYELENDWKTSWIGIILICGIWCAAFHNLYSLSALSVNAMNAFNLLIFDIGLIYFCTFLGVSGGIILSSIILNQQSMIESSQIIATYSIFVVFLCQSIASIIFYYTYYYETGDNKEITIFCWYILLISRFLLGAAVGFIETSIDNLLFEWFAIVDEEYFISKASPYTLLFKEFGHLSARLILVPLVWITLSSNQNLFFSLLFGVILSALSWISMIYAAMKDSKIRFDQMIRSRNKTNNDGNRVNTTDPTKPLLPSHSYTVNKNEWMIKQISSDIISYRKWYEMGFIGFNKSVFLSIIYLSLNFSISFTFIILSLISFVEIYGYTDYTSNLLLCLIPILNIICSGFIRNYILSPLKSEWIIAVIGCIAFSTIFSLLSWLNTSSWVLPFISSLIFVFGYECFTAAGYELLLSSTKQEIHGLISAVNSSTNYFFSSIFVIIFATLVIGQQQQQQQNINIYSWSYSLLAFASYFNIIIIVLLKLYHSTIT